MTDYSKLAEKTHIALITETWRESVARDLTTAATFLGLWSIGHYADSAALEWIGVFCGALMLFVRAVSIFKGALDKRMTPDEARAWLDRNFPKEDKQ